MSSKQKTLLVPVENLTIVIKWREQFGRCWKLQRKHVLPLPPTCAISIAVDSVRMDFQLNQKISKRRFFQDIKNSFQWVIGNGLKPTQFFSFQNTSTNTVARDVQSFGQNGPWLAGWLSRDQNFFVNFAQTCDEQMLKISRRYLDWYLNDCKITDYIVQLGTFA